MIGCTAGFHESKVPEVQSLHQNPSDNTEIQHARSPFGPPPPHGRRKEVGTSMVSWYGIMVLCYRYGMV